MSDKEELVISPIMVSYERIRAIKEGVASFLDSEYDSVKLVGLSLIFVDTKSDVRIEHKEKVAWFDESQYEDDEDAWDEEEDEE
jgi:hypothetical protein